MADFIEHSRGCPELSQVHLILGTRIFVQIRIRGITGPFLWGFEAGECEGICRPSVLVYTRSSVLLL